MPFFSRRSSGPFPFFSWVCRTLVLCSLNARGHICLDGTSVAGIEDFRIYHLNIDIRFHTFIQKRTVPWQRCCCKFMGLPSYFAAHVLNGRVCLGTFDVEEGVHEHIREVVSSVVGASCSFSWFCGPLWFLCGSLFCFLVLLGAHFLIHWHLHSSLRCSSRIWITSSCIVSVADIKAVLSNCGVFLPLVRIVGSYASIVASSPNSISLNRKTTELVITVSPR